MVSEVETSNRKFGFKYLYVDEFRQRSCVSQLIVRIPEGRWRQAAKSKLRSQSFLGEDRRQQNIGIIRIDVAHFNY